MQDNKTMRPGLGSEGQSGQPQQQPTAEADFGGPEASEMFFMVEDKNGFLTRVRADKLEQWRKTQEERGNDPLTKEERAMSDAIVRSIYGSKE